MTTKELVASLRLRYLGADKVHGQPLQTKVGDRVRPCFNATLSGTTLAPPLVPARLGNVFVVDAMAGGAVRIGGNCWCKSWVRVNQ